VAIDEVLAGFGASLTSDARAGAVSVQRGSHELLLHHGKSLASLDGDLRLLSSPALLEGGRWLVPVDVLARLLGPLPRAAGRVATGPRVLVVGPVAIPRVSVSTFVSAEVVRVVFEASETVPFRVRQEAGRVTVSVARDLVDVSVPPGRLSGGIVEAVQFLGGRRTSSRCSSGPASGR
jgi:hypothetical protein